MIHLRAYTKYLREPRGVTRHIRQALLSNLTDIRNQTRRSGTTQGRTSKTFIVFIHIQKEAGTLRSISQPSPHSFREASVFSDHLGGTSLIPHLRLQPASLSTNFAEKHTYTLYSLTTYHLKSAPVRRTHQKKNNILGTSKNSANFDFASCSSSQNSNFASNFDFLEVPILQIDECRTMSSGTAKTTAVRFRWRCRAFVRTHRQLV